MTIDGIEWTPEPEGEYGEHSAVVGGRHVVLYSDREGTTWQYTVDDNEYLSLDADNLRAAAREAAKEVASWSPPDRGGRGASEAEGG